MFLAKHCGYLQLGICALSRINLASCQLECIDYGLCTPKIYYIRNLLEYTVKCSMSEITLL